MVADNEELEPPHVVDSRSFGPLPLSNILGRIMWAPCRHSVPALDLRLRRPARLPLQGAASWLA